MHENPGFPLCSQQGVQEDGHMSSRWERAKLGEAQLAPSTSITLFLYNPREGRLHCLVRYVEIETEDDVCYAVQEIAGTKETQRKQQARRSLGARLRGRWKARS